MKRRLVVMVMSCVLTVALITGCGNKKAETPTMVETKATQEETNTVETMNTAEEETEGVKEENAKPAESVDYLSWTASEWKAASDDDKAEATKLYLIESMKVATEAMGQEFTSQMESTITDEAVKASIVTLDTAFAADPNMKLQDILDITNEAAAKMEEMVTQPAQ